MWAQSATRTPEDPLEKEMANHFRSCAMVSIKMIKEMSFEDDILRSESVPIGKKQRKTTNTCITNKTTEPNRKGSLAVNDSVDKRKV